MKCKCKHDLNEHQEYILPEDCDKCHGNPDISCDCESQQCTICECYSFNKGGKDD